MYKQYYRKFLHANKKRLHFTAHSHHYWPDVTRAAMTRYWDDSAHYVDDKWDIVLGRIVPTAQQHIAKILGLSHPDCIAFAPNTHEFVIRLLSAFNWDRPLRVLTTDGEYHSFARQINRLAELPPVTVVRVPTLPLTTFEERFKTMAATHEFDLVFFSHVFFNSGLVIRDLAAIVRAVRSDYAQIVIDGYHSFAALPFSLRELEHRVFFLAGGYKYAQSGEGACFLHIPPGCRLRPVNTGWFAAFGTLDQAPGQTVPYSHDAYRFWGATFDPGGLYRFNAVMKWLDDQELSVDTIHHYVRDVQEYFLAKLAEHDCPRLNHHHLLIPDADDRAHFITFELTEAAEIARQLRERNIITDVRGTRLRFGFGLYHDHSDIDRLFQILTEKPLVVPERVIVQAAGHQLSA